jgi:2-oxoglutarate ferredoxin oxidoreductase subunit alpha
MEDELGGIAAVVGASTGGMKAFTATSGPGFSLMQEEIGIAAIMEVPCVIVDVQRVGPGTGVATKPAQGDFMQARYGSHGDHTIIALSPSSVQECYDYALTAFNFAEQYRTPVIFLMDGIIGHLHESYVRHVFPADKIINRKLPQGDPKDFLPYDFTHSPDGEAPFAVYGGKYFQHSSGTTHDFRGLTLMKPDMIKMFNDHYMNKIEGHVKDLAIVNKFDMDDAEIALVSFGCSVRSARAAARKARAQGIKAGVVQMVTVWPFPAHIIDELCGQVKAFVVPEMNYGQMQKEVRLAAAGRVPVYGVNKVNTEIIRPDEIVAKIMEANK